jgi:hypothetical protein
LRHNPPRRIPPIACQLLAAPDANWNYDCAFPVSKLFSVMPEEKWPAWFRDGAFYATICAFLQALSQNEVGTWQDAFKLS